MSLPPICRLCAVTFGSFSRIYEFTGRNRRLRRPSRQQSRDIGVGLALVKGVQPAVSVNEFLFIAGEAPRAGFGWRVRE